MTLKRYVLLGLCVTALLCQHADVAARERNRGARQRAGAASMADRQRELMSLQQSIAADRKLIASLREKEKSTIHTIQQLQRHSANIQRFMFLLEAEIASLQDAADSASVQSFTAAGTLSKVHGGYAGLARSMSMAPSAASSAQRPQSQEDAVLLRRITAQARTASTTLASQRDSLSEASFALRSKSERRASLLAMKESEQKELEKMRVMTEKALADIRSNTKSLAENLRKNERSAAQVQSAIRDMVTEDKRRQREQAVQQSKRAVAEEQERSMRGNGTFSYPVTGRRILHGFGTYRNPVTNTMANNPGVDIEAPAGSTVRSIAAGTVSLVSWLPGYMSVIIVDHHNGYRSVYANMASVRVRKGQRLSAQTPVGTSGESFDGEFVHLQIWKDRERVNPLSLLR